MEEGYKEIREEQHFDRGTNLSVFKSDRFEDFAALLAAFAIAIGVLMYVGK